MDLSNFYICLCLVVVIEAISIPQYAYREIAVEHDKAEALQKKAPIPILKQSFEQSKEGYQFSYDTGNGIHAEESGYIKNKGDEKHEVVVQQGTITYHDEHGKPISLTYIADEKGFRPQGAHLPTPPPIPEEILKSLEKNAQEELQEQQKEQQQEQHVEQEHHVQVSLPAQKEAQVEYQYQQPQQEVEYEAPQQQISQKEYQKLIQEQIQKQLREEPQQQYYPQQEYRVKYHQAGY